MNHNKQPELPEFQALLSSPARYDGAAGPDPGLEYDDVPHCVVEVFQGDHVARRPFFDLNRMPHEVFLLAAQHLNARELLTLGECNTDLLRASSSQRLWRDLLARDFPDQRQGLLGMAGLRTAKEQYIRRQREEVRRREEEARAARERQLEREEEARHAARQAKRQQCSYVFHIWGESGIFCVMPALAIAAVVLVCIHTIHTKGQWPVDGLASSALPWTIGGIVLAMAILMCITISLSCYIAFRRHPVPFDDDAFEQGRNIAEMALRGFGVARRDRLAKYRSAHACSTLSCVFVFVVFVVLKLTQSIGWPWWAVFLPAMVGVLLQIELVFLVEAPFLFRLKPLFAFALFHVGWMVPLWLRVQSVWKAPVSVICAPLWLVEFSLFVSILFQHHRTPKLLVWGLLVLPMAVFQFMLVLKVDKGSAFTWWGVFIPLIFWLSVWQCLGCVVAVLQYGDARRRLR